MRPNTRTAAALSAMWILIGVAISTAIAQQSDARPRKTVTTKTRKEVETLIDTQGRTPPEWFEETPLSLPPTLDLSFPEKAEGGWDNQKNVGQYVWDVINPNPGKWREGVRLMHLLLQKHQGDVEKRTRAMNELGRMYHDLLEDYPRAAFWWRQAKVDQPNSRFSRSAALLAGCYARLGNKPMAVQLLQKLEKQRMNINVVKVWGDLGEADRAIRLSARFAKSSPGEAAMLAADACRVAGRTKDAISHYNKVLRVPATGPQEGRIERLHARAKANLEAIVLYELADVTKVPDGRYAADSLGYEGPVRVEVVVEGGAIESVRVTDHIEKQFYAAMTDTPAKIIAKQSVRGIDATSNATITSEAIINATAKALASAEAK